MPKEMSDIDSTENPSREVSTAESAKQAGPTVLQRMAGLPQHLLAVGGLSDRDTRRALISARVEARHQARS